MGVNERSEQRMGPFGRVGQWWNQTGARPQPSFPGTERAIAPEPVVSPTVEPVQEARFTKRLEGPSNQNFDVIDHTEKPTLHTPIPDNVSVLKPRSPEFVLTKEVTQHWGVRRISPGDVKEVAEWFRDGKVAKQIGNDRIDPFKPKDWDDPAQKERFVRALHKFYFPQGPVKLELKIPPHVDEEGEEAPVKLDEEKMRMKTKYSQENGKWYLSASQSSNVCTINGEVVAVQSWYTDDPYAPLAAREEIDEGRQKAAHGLVLITKPDFRHSGVATFLTFARSDELLGTGEENPGNFTQISGLVNYIDSEDGRDEKGVLRLFEHLGYGLDRNRDGLAVRQIVNGREARMWRVVLGQKRWWKQRQELLKELNATTQTK